VHGDTLVVLWLLLRVSSWFALSSGCGGRVSMLLLAKALCGCRGVESRHSYMVCMVAVAELVFAEV